MITKISINGAEQNFDNPVSGTVIGYSAVRHFYNDEDGNYNIFNYSYDASYNNVDIIDIIDSYSLKRGNNFYNDYPLLTDNDIDKFYSVTSLNEYYDDKKLKEESNYYNSYSLNKYDEFDFSNYNSYNLYTAYQKFDAYLPRDAYNNYLNHHAYEVDDYWLLTDRVSGINGIELNNDDKWFFVTEQLDEDIDNSYDALHNYINLRENIDENIISEYADKYFDNVDSYDTSYKDYNPLGIILQTNPLWAPYKEDIIEHIQNVFTNKEIYHEVIDE